MNKTVIIDRNAVEMTLRERRLWVKFSHPLLVTFHYAFQDITSLYAVVTLMLGGDMRYHLNKEKCFNLERCKFYSAQIAIACNYIHSLEFVHRDIKPDNLLFDGYGNIWLTDFNLTKKMVGEKLKDRAGTRRYMSPELVHEKGYNYSTDYWSLGVVLYEMYTGRTPFTYREVVKHKDSIMSRLRIPEGTPPELEEVIKGLICLKPKKRWGFEQLKLSKWFSDINLDDLSKKLVETPWVPNTKKANVDGTYALDELVAKNEKPRALTKEEQELFNHWDYNPVVNSPDDSSQNYENIPERKKDHSNSDSSDSSSKEDKVNNDEEVDDPPINTFPKQNIKLNDQNDIKTDRTDKKTHKNKNNGSEKIQKYQTPKNPKN